MRQLFAFLFTILLVSCAGPKGESLMPTADGSNWRVVAAEAHAETSADEIVLQDNLVMIYAPADEAAAMPQFRNFVLSAKILAGANEASSLWFHHGEAYGYEVVLGGRRMDASRQTTGSLNNVRNVYKSMAAEGEWWDLEVAVVGKHIAVKINGDPVVDYVEPAEPYRVMPGFGRLGAGTFVLDSYAGTTRVRDMKVRRLEDDATGYNNGKAIVEARVDAVDETNDKVIRLLQANFPVIDFHVHLKGWDVEQALANSRRVGIFYGLAPNCGIGFQYTTDAEVDVFIQENKLKSAFMAMQGEGREWPTTFSAATRDKFDYVFTDALTFTDHAGRRVRLWIDEEVVIDVPQEQYMELIVDKIVEVVSTEPIDIYVNPFFLPTAMMDRYDEWWTDERIARVIDVLVEKGVALEVNARYRIPNAKTIRAAMEAGVPLAFGTNNGSAEDIGALEYCFEMLDECGIEARHMYFPR